MQILKRNRISRRTLLRGAGAALGLPLLECMAAPAAAPLRSAFIFVPGGVNHDEWLPETEGRSYEPSATLAALEPVREHVLVLSRLNARKGETGGNGHPLGTGPWLSSAPINEKDRGGYCTDISIDQQIANQVGVETRLPSLELGCDRDSRNMHESNISWRGPASPLGKESDPQAVYNRLFADPKSDVYRLSILDAVREDAKRIGSTMSGVDREKLDEYFESVRSIERQIEFAAKHQLEAPPKVEIPEDVEDRFMDHVNLLSDLLVLAFQSDTTRVSTFMYNNEPGRNHWPEIGIKENHHTLAHLDPRTAEGQDRLEKLQKIDEAYLKIWVRMLEKLAAVPEGDGKLIDNCQILYGSPLTWGRLHNRDNIPVLMAGAVDGGQHINYNDRALADLHLAMLHRSGVKIDRVADSNGALPI
ncbi:MAG: DUF1552 domain-containing protein [Verrucomicrobiota bacterium]